MTRILVIGDSYMPAEVFVDALRERGLESDSATITITDAPTWSVDGLRELEGDPAETSALLDGHEVLVVHGVPVSREVLEANPSLRLIACARGGPVNIDVTAAKELGMLVATTPGKNAAAVADLTIGFLISGLRNLVPSVKDVDATSASGGVIAESTFEGAKWFGREIAHRTLGLIGLGNVARLVAARANALGMTVLAFDPYVTSDVAGVERVADLDDLLARSEVVSVHARATPENRHLFDADRFARMPAGAFFINTARESLVDEQALLEALRSGHLSGAALDVCEPDGPWRELAGWPNVTITPHIAGATFETLRRGAEMLAEQILEWQAGRELRWPA